MICGIEKLEYEVRRYVQDNSSEMPYWLYSNLTDRIDKASEVLETDLKAKDREILALIQRVADITKENVEANNRIAELEAKLEPKSCDGCKYEEDKRGGNCYAFSSCYRDSFDHYTPKERG